MSKGQMKRKYQVSFKTWIDPLEALKASSLVNLMF